LCSRPRLSCWFRAHGLQFTVHQLTQSVSGYYTKGSPNNQTRKARDAPAPSAASSLRCLRAYRVRRRAAASPASARRPSVAGSGTMFNRQFRPATGRLTRIDKAIRVSLISHHGKAVVRRRAVQPRLDERQRDRPGACAAVIGDARAKGPVCVQAIPEIRVVKRRQTSSTSPLVSTNGACSRYGVNAIAPKFGSTQPY